MRGKKLNKDWTQWARIAKHRPDMGEFTREHDLDSYPRTVKEAILGALTLAQVSLESRGIMRADEPLPFCSVYDDDCKSCPASSNRACRMEGHSIEDVEEAEKLYKELYGMMPERYKL